MTGVEKWVVGGVMFVGMFVVLVLLRAVYDAFKEP